MVVAAAAQGLQVVEDERFVDGGREPLFATQDAEATALPKVDQIKHAGRDVLALVAAPVAATPLLGLHGPSDESGAAAGAGSGAAGLVSVGGVSCRSSSSRSAAKARRRSRRSSE